MTFYRFKMELLREKNLEEAVLKESSKPNVVGEVLRAKRGAP